MKWASVLVALGAAAPAWADGVSLDDFALFPDCMAGPDSSYPEDCDTFDFNGDLDVDLADMAGFQRAFGKSTTPHVVIDTVTVGNPGNANDTRGAGYGGVDYVYNIGKYEVTAGQYTAFLNAVAATDTYGLYNPSMDGSSFGCQITQKRTSGSYTYDFSGGRPNGTEADWLGRPVNYVSWGDVARFTNWLHNRQPTGTQDLTTTEDGSYYLNGAMSNAELIDIEREPDATWVIPSEDEWYKAAYHYNDGVTGNYFAYPMSSDSIPSNYLVVPDPGNNATFYLDVHTIGSPYYRTVFGAHQNSDSPYGTFDQGGNIFEWNETAFFESARGFRGGAFPNSSINLSAGVRHYHSAAGELRNVGFRVAKVP